MHISLWNRAFTCIRMVLMAGMAWCLLLGITYASETPSGLALWYDKLAAGWLEALPVGNGRIGCMVFGGVESDRLQLNEVSVWSGSPQDSDNPDALATLPEIRQFLFDGKYDQAKELSAKKLICKGVGTRGAASAKDPFGCFQTLGDLVLKFALTWKART